MSGKREATVLVQPVYKQVVLFTSDTLCFALTGKQLFFNGQHHSINEVQADRGDKLALCLEQHAGVSS